MSDIRNFFKPGAGKKPAAGAANATAKSTPKKRKAVISSDEDDDAPPKRTGTPPKPSLKKLKKTTADIKPTAARGKAVVDVSTAFGGDSIARVERPKAKPKVTASTADALDSHFDEAFDDSLAEIDSSLLMEANGDVAERLEKSSGGVKEEEVEEVPAQVKREVSSPPKKMKTPAKKAETPKSRKRSAEDSLNESVLTDEDRFEKKRMAAAMYQQFRNRSGPANPGTKELPKGKPNCLASLTFILTGVLDSLDREAATDLIREHGGKVTTSLSKKTSYMVVGEDAGLKKLATAEELKTGILSEDDLLNLIRRKSGLPVVEAVEPTQRASPPAPIVVKKEVVKKETAKKVPAAIKSETITPPKATNGAVHTNGVHIKIEPKAEDVHAPRVETEHERNIASVENQAWVDKYKPTSVKQIIGQQGTASNVAKLTNWLTKWYVNQASGAKPARPNPWAKNDDGAFYKAALLSGPPGVGKTTTATLVSRELGFDVVEFNASDTRSKRLLKEEVSELLSNKSLYGYFRGTKDAVTVKHVLLMDEVDGMAGNEDRGGLQELIALIRDSSVPVICMCNDRNHQKMRSLVNHCYDLRFARPPLGQIKGPMMSICYKEGFKVAPGVLEEIIAATNNDIRQTLNHLTLMRAGGQLEAARQQTAGDANATAASVVAPHHSTAKKDMKLGPWEVVRRVFSADEHKTMSLADKADLFFHDYSLGPLFVQQNYLQVVPRVPKAEIPQRVALAADSLSRGDLVENRIRSKMAWSMLPVQAMFSSVMPGEYMSGTITGQINFPGWLGKHSKSSKRSRMAQEIHDHTRIRTSGSRQSIRLDYAGFLIDAVARPLRERGLEGVNDALAVLREYQLLREDIDSLLELSTWPGQKNAFDGIESRVKAALTRAYNKDVGPYSFSAAAAVKKRKTDIATAGDDGDTYDCGEEQAGGDSESAATASVAQSEEEEEDTDMDNDVLIKAKKKSTAGTTKSAAAKSKGASGSKSSVAGKAKSVKSK